MVVKARSMSALVAGRAIIYEKDLGMTPFGAAIRKLRQERAISQKQMAEGIGVSPAYLSAMEHGHRSPPSFDFLQRVAGFFNIIWDDADRLFQLAELSNPKITMDTHGLDPAYTEFANRLSREIRLLDRQAIDDMREIVENSVQRRKE